MPAMTNPAEFLLELTNVDFYEDKATAEQVLARVQKSWGTREDTQQTVESTSREKGNELKASVKESHDISSRFAIPITLIHRLLIKSVRDVVTYWIRVVMYMGKSLVVLVRHNTKPNFRSCYHDGYRLAPT